MSQPDNCTQVRGTWNDCGEEEEHSGCFYYDLDALGLCDRKRIGFGEDVNVLLIWLVYVGVFGVAWLQYHLYV